MKTALVIAMPTTLMVALLYSNWHNRGRRGPFLDEIRSNLFALVAFLFSLIMLSISARQ